VISDGLPISQVAEKVGVSRQTRHAWLARYEAQGLRDWFGDLRRICVGHLSILSAEGAAASKLLRW